MFCKFLVCHGFDLFFCQAMALLVLPEKKKSIRKKKKIYISRVIAKIANWKPQ